MTKTIQSSQAASLTPSTTREDFITCKEAAAAVKLSEISIRRMLTKGRLTRYKIGARTLISVSELFALIRKSA
jgi:excisionase family DNA binding protein